MFRSLFLITLCALLTLPLAAHANDAEGARRFVDDLGQRVLATVNGESPAAYKQEQLRRLFSENVDMEWMGRFVLGRNWTGASAQERQQYLQAYREYLLARYTTNFADYAGSEYRITDVKPNKQGQFIVSMQVKSPEAEKQETTAGYRVRMSENGNFKIADIAVEGVSLITTQRSEFASIVREEGLSGLVGRLQAKGPTPN